MIIGNITLNPKPCGGDLEDGGICGCCLCECEAAPIDESFSDPFGNVESWRIGSACCEADIFEGAIFMEKRTKHTARKDHKDGKIKAGQRYSCYIRKGYYIDDDGKHHGIYEYKKTVIEEMAKA